MTPDTSRNDDAMIGSVSLLRSLQRQHGELFGLAIILVAVLVFFAATSPRFLTLGTFQSITFQLPVLGLLTLAMLMPIVSGGFNLAVTFTANIAGLAMAWVLQSMGGPDAGIAAFGLAVVAALAAGTLAGWVMAKGEPLWSAFQLASACAQPQPVS